MTDSHHSPKIFIIRVCQCVDDVSVITGIGEGNQPLDFKSRLNMQVTPLINGV
jgi:hypothetical protein